MHRGCHRCWSYRAQVTEPVVSAVPVASKLAGAPKVAEGVSPSGQSATCPNTFDSVVIRAMTVTAKADPKSARRMDISVHRKVPGWGYQWGYFRSVDQQTYNISIQ